MISLLVDDDAKIGPLGARGTIMFALYLLGAVSAMIAAWVVKRLTDRGGVLLPFYMEMPPYRLPRPKTVAVMVWDACKGFAKKAGTIITATTIILWVLLNVPMRSDAQFDSYCAATPECAAISAAADDPSSSTVTNDDGETVTDSEELDKLLEAQKTSYTMDNSWGAAVGKMVQPACTSNKNFLRSTKKCSFHFSENSARKNRRYPYEKNTLRIRTVLHCNTS